MGQRGQIKEDELNLGGLQAHCVKPNKSRSNTGQMERSLTHLLWRNISITQTTSHFYQKQLQLKFHSGPSEVEGGTIYFYTTWILFRNLTWILSQCGTWGKPWMSAVLIELCVNTTVMDGLEDMGHNGVNWKQSWRVRTDDLAAGLRRAPDWQHMAGVEQSFFCLSTCQFISPYVSRLYTHARYLSNVLWARALLYWILTAVIPPKAISIVNVILPDIVIKLL